MVLLEETSIRLAIVTSIIAGVFAVLSAVLTQAISSWPKSKRLLRLVTYFFVLVCLIGLAWSLWPVSPAVAIDIMEMPHFNAVDSMSVIGGRVKGVKTPSEFRVVVYAKGEQLWYIQPNPENPKIGIADDGTWKTDTRYGSSYGALVVKQSYTPSSNPQALPNLDENVLATTERRGESVH